MGGCLKEPVVKIQLGVEHRVVKQLYTHLLDTIFHCETKRDILIHFGRKIQCRPGNPIT